MVATHYIYQYHGMLILCPSVCVYGHVAKIAIAILQTHMYRMVLTKVTNLINLLSQYILNLIIASFIAKKISCGKHNLGTMQFVCECSHIVLTIHFTLG